MTLYTSKNHRDTLWSIEEYEGFFVAVGPLRLGVCSEVILFDDNIYRFNKKTKVEKP